MSQTYDSGPFRKYPLWAEEMSFEGAVSIYKPMPGPKEVFDFVMLGMQKILPMTGQSLKQEDVEPFISSAIAEIEMDLGCEITEKTLYHHEDLVADKFNLNMMGIKLTRWPAIKIENVQIKFPHAATATPFQKYTVPPQWVFLRKNKMNIVASTGAIVGTTDNSAIANAGGIFTFITGFGNNSFQPGLIEIVYKAGYEHDKLPANVADLVKTWAAWGYLANILPVLFPAASTSVAIDGVSQSVGLSIQQMLTQRVAFLEQRKKELAASFKKNHSRTVKISYIGA